MGAALALLASLSWGTSDFIGGTLSRRLHPVAVMRLAQAMALVGLAVVAVATRSLGASGYLMWGVLAGVAGVVGLGCFYSALAQGTMGVVAPIAATGVVVPVAVGLAQGESPALLQFVGIALTVVGVVLASGPERDAHGAKQDRNLRPMLLAGVASVGFGATLVLVAEGSKGSVIMTLLTMRVVNVILTSAFLLTAGRRLARPVGSDLPAIAATGAADAGANGLYALATQSSLVSVSAVLASLYPAVTALLAWRFHREHMRPVQIAGVATTLAGVALIALGGA